MLFKERRKKKFISCDGFYFKNLLNIIKGLLEICISMFNTGYVVSKQEVGDRFLLEFAVATTASHELIERRAANLHQYHQVSHH